MAKKGNGRQEKNKRLNGRGSFMLIPIDTFNMIYEMHFGTINARDELYIVGVRRQCGYTVKQCAEMAAFGTTAIQTRLDRAKKWLNVWHTEYDPVFCERLALLRKVCKSFAVPKRKPKKEVNS